MSTNESAVPAAQREKDLDVARGIGMLAVMTAHMKVDRMLYTLIYTFHLPLFFFISGYCFKYDEKFSRFALKKIKGYLVPYVFCALIILIYDVIVSLINHKGYKMVVPEIMKFVVQVRYTTLWFLATLFLGTMIFWLIHKVCRHKLYPVTIVSIILGILFILYDTKVKVSLPWNLDTAFIIQIYLSLGYFCKEKGILVKLRKHALINFVIFTAVSLLCSYLNFRKGGYMNIYEMYRNSYGIFPLTVTAAVTGSIAVIMLSSKLCMLKPLEWLGRNTMVFFAFHQAIALPMAGTLLDTVLRSTKYRMPSSPVYMILQMILMLLICYCMQFIIVKSHLGFMIGKSKK